jgi:hypothetical protein
MCRVLFHRHSSYLNAVAAIESERCNTSVPGIPKLIHQTHKTVPLPTILADNVANLKALNPTWEHRFYTDLDQQEFIAAEFGTDLLTQYCRIDPKYGAARADLFRYLCLFRLGGVYLDIKSGLKKPLNAVVRNNDMFLLSHWQNAPGAPFERFGLHRVLQHIPQGEYQQWFLVASPRHPFLRAVILKVLENIDKYSLGYFPAGRMGTVSVTGPIAYSLAIFPLVEKYPCRIVDVSSDCGFVYNVYAGRSEQRRRDLGAHYSELRSPVVSLGYVKTVQWFFSYVARRLLSFMTRSIRSVGRSTE